MPGGQDLAAPSEETFQKEETEPAPPPACGDWLAVAREHLPDSLCNPLAWDRLDALACHLPGDCQAAIEIHLRDGVIDLSIRVNKPGQARRLAQQPLPAHLRDFLLRWSEKEEAFSPISCLWLEYDLGRQGAGIPNPSVCARLPAGVDLDWLLGSLLPALHGEPLTPSQRQRIRRCHREIPEGGSLLYVFSLLGRDGHPIRMELFGLDAAQALSYLRRVAPHAAPPLAGIAPVLDGAERLHLSFDIGEEILPRVGLEGSFARLPEREPRWRQLFDRLIAHGLSTPLQREAALAWPGYDTFWTAAARWPVERAGVRGFCARGLSHVKLVCQPDRAPEAKVYLLVSYLDGTASSPARCSAVST